jgi:hypothetical protein
VFPTHHTLCGVFQKTHKHASQRLPKKSSSRRLFLVFIISFCGEEGGPKLAPFGFPTIFTVGKRRKLLLRREFFSDTPERQRPNRHNTYPDPANRARLPCQPKRTHFLLDGPTLNPSRSANSFGETDPCRRRVDLIRNENEHPTSSSTLVPL